MSDPQSIDRLTAFSHFISQAKFVILELALLAVFIVGVYKVLIWELHASPPRDDGEQTANDGKISDVANRCCKVSITDKDNITHTVQVSATTLYEAVALGLNAVKKNAWVGQIPDGLNTVRVEILDDPIVHNVQISDFQKWLNRSSASPADQVAKARIRGILQ